MPRILYQVLWTVGNIDTSSQRVVILFLSGQGSVAAEAVKGPRFLWIILVINGGIVAVAIIIGMYVKDI